MSGLTEFGSQLKELEVCTHEINLVRKLEKHKTTVLFVLFVLSFICLSRGGLGIGFMTDNKLNA